MPKPEQASGRTNPRIIAALHQPSPSFHGDEAVSHQHTPDQLDAMRNAQYGEFLRQYPELNTERGEQEIDQISQTLAAGGAVESLLPGLEKRLRPKKTKPQNGVF